MIDAVRITVAPDRLVLWDGAPWFFWHPTVGRSFADFVRVVRYNAAPGRPFEIRPTRSAPRQPDPGATPGAEPRA